MGRKRILPMLSFHGQGLLLLAAVSSPHCKSVRRSCAPSFLTHVRLGEHGAPVQARGLQSSLPPLRRRRTPRRLPPNLVSQSPFAVPFVTGLKTPCGIPTGSPSP